MAAADPPETPAASTQGTVFVDCPDEIAATRGLEATVGSQQGTECDLVETNHADQ